MNQKLVKNIGDTMQWKHEQEVQKVRDYAPKPLPKATKQAVKQIHADLEEAKQTITDNSASITYWISALCKALCGITPFPLPQDDRENVLSNDTELAIRYG